MFAIIENLHSSAVFLDTRYFSLIEDPFEILTKKQRFKFLLSYFYYKRKKIDYDVLVTMNDWDVNNSKILVEKAKKEKKCIIGIIEGINDFMDLDTGFQRNAYQSVDYLLLTGEHDKKFFHNKSDKTCVIGIPRLASLIKEPPSFPTEIKILININFSYGILEEKRLFWLQSVIDACNILNIKFWITQHPADKADLSHLPVLKCNVYEAIRKSSLIISRFSSIIIESLTMGKPVIYHNPHKEKAIKFQEPLGAYSISDDTNSLVKAIKYELDNGYNCREKAYKFLQYHANIDKVHESPKIAAKAIEKWSRNYKRAINTS